MAQPPDAARFGQAVQQAGIGYLGGLLSLALGFASKVIAVRLTSVAVYGIYTAALALLTIAVGVAQLGVQDALARTVALDRSRGAVALRAALLLGVGMSVILTALLLILSPTISAVILKAPESAGALGWLWIALPLWTAANLIAAYFQGLGHIAYRALLVDSSRLAVFCLLALVLIPVWAQTPLMLLVVATVLSTAVSLTLIAWRAQIQTLLQRPADRLPFRDLLRYGLPLVAGNLITLIVTSGNSLVLSVLATPAEVAYYTTTLALGQLVGIGGIALDVVLLPMFTDLYASDQHETLNSLYWSMAKWSLILITPLAFVLVTFPEQILHLLFGEAYTPAASALRAVVGFYLLHVAAGPDEAALKTAGNTGILFALRVITVVSIVGIGWGLTIPFGYAGMIVGWGVGLTLYNAVLLRTLHRRHILFSIPHRVLLAMMLCLVAVIVPGWFFAITPILAYVIFAGSLIAALVVGVQPTDRAMMQAVIQRVRRLRYP